LTLYLFEKNYTRYSINLQELDKYSLALDNLNFNKESLSSDQIFDTNIAIAWSNQILGNIEKSIPLPRTFLSQLPNDLGKYDTARKKKLFISILLPIILRGNEIVIEEQISMKTAFSENNIEKIEYYSKRYKVKNWKKINFYNMSFAQMIKIKEELLKKINQIPVSMMLAQAAIESGWGSSRFAKEGNALFGEWTWKNNSGLKPRGNVNAKFAVKSFINISASVNSYILNLNSHPAYKRMRNFRFLIIKSGKSLSGVETANYLDKYAAIGFEYVIKVTSMIKNNKFDKFDNIKLENNYN
jgi:Bax protein